MTDATSPGSSNSNSNSKSNSNSSDSGADDTGAADWAAALAEQTAAAAAAATVTPAAMHAFPQIPQAAPAGAGPDGDGDLARVLDVPVQLTAEIGRTRITIKNLLRLSQGSVVELDGMAGQPLDVLINGYLIAQGEVVVVNDKYGIRLTDIITPSERVQKLARS